MTYADAIATPTQRVQWILKIAGVDRYFSTLPDSTWNDTAATPSTHGSQTNSPTLYPPSVSGGRLNPQENVITASTAKIELQDESYLTTTLSRRVDSQFITNDLTAVGTVVAVADNTDFTAETYAHIGRETIWISALDGGGTDMTIQRGKLGTTAEVHPADTEIANTPRHWKGRQAWLILGSRTPAGTWHYKQFRQYTIESSPAFNNGSWTFNLTSGLEFYDRPIYTGFHETKINKIEHASVGDKRYFKIWVDDITQFIETGVSPSPQDLGVVLEGGGHRGAYIIASGSVDSSGFFLVYPWQSDIISPFTFTHTEWESENDVWEWFYKVVDTNTLEIIKSDVTARPFYPMMWNTGTSQAALMALRIMLSDLGDGTIESSYDVLGGAAPTEYVSKKRAGAGLTTDQVDIASWKAAQAGSMPCSGFHLGIDGQESLLEVLQRDFAPALGGYIYMNSENKIAFKKYQAEAKSATSLTQINEDSNFAGDNAIDDEEAIVSHIQIMAKYDWTNSNFRSEFNSYYLNLEHQYGDVARKFVIKSRLLGVDETHVQTIFDRYITRFGLGAIRYSTLAPWSHHLLNPGDLIEYTNPRIPNFEGGTGVAQQKCEITSASADIAAGTTKINLLRVPTSKLIAPILETEGAAPASGSTTWDIVANQYTDQDADDEWAVGWEVRAVSAVGVVRASSNETITGLTATTVTLSGTISGMVSGDWLMFANKSDVDAGSYTQENNTTTGDMLDHAFVGAGGYNSAGDKWS